MITHFLRQFTGLQNLSVVSLCLFSCLAWLYEDEDDDEVDKDNEDDGDDEDNRAKYTQLKYDWVSFTRQTWHFG